MWPITHSPRVAVYRSVLLCDYIFFEVIVIDNHTIIGFNMTAHGVIDDNYLENSHLDTATLIPEH